MSGPREGVKENGEMAMKCQARTRRIHAIKGIRTLDVLTSEKCGRGEGDPTRFKPSGISSVVALILFIRFFGPRKVYTIRSRNNNVI